MTAYKLIRIKDDKKEKKDQKDEKKDGASKQDSNDKM
jgi:hypothetical protein